MLKIRFCSFALFAVALSLFAATAHAQANPTPQETNNYRNKPCRDPWINIAYERAGLGKPHGAGDAGECSPKYYRNGRWNSYAELFGAVRRYRSGLAAKSIVTGLVRTAARRSEARLVFKKNGHILGVAADIMQAVAGIMPPEVLNIISEVADAELRAAGSVTVAPKSGYHLLSGARESVEIGDDSILVIR